jgi:hypothetical protein
MTHTCAKHLVSQSVDDVVAIILKGLDSVITLGGNVGTWLGKGDAPDLDRGDAITADGSSLRQLQVWIKEKNPSFGGLIRVQNKRREFLWVHPQFENEY